MTVFFERPEPIGEARDMKYPDAFLNHILCGDCLEIMRFIPDRAIDLVVTSPPYNLRRSSGSGMKDGRGSKWANAALRRGYAHWEDNLPHPAYVAWQRACLDEMMRVLADDGAAFWVHKPRVQNGLLQDRQDILQGFPVRQVIIWKRQGGINFNPHYYLPTYEQIFLIAKQPFRLAPGANAYSDVWPLAQERHNPHPAPFPLQLALRVIGSTRARVVLDPFVGSGTTCVAAQQLGRQYIGIDVCRAYCELAERRLAAARRGESDDAWQRAATASAAARRTRGERIRPAGPKPSGPESARAPSGGPESDAGNR